MRALTLTFILAIVLHLVVGVDAANALPQCSNSSYRHNCNDTVTYSTGTKYVGSFKDNKANGQGTLTFGEGTKWKGDIYVGSFKDYKIHGQGTYTEVNGSWYVGAFKNGKRNGQGTYNYANGDKYVGAFKNNESHGQGTYTYADGHIEEGIWENGEFLYAQKAPASEKTSTVANTLPKCTDPSYRHNCEDTVTYPSGEKYVGAFKDNKRHGQGALTLMSGAIYVGKSVGGWRAGKRHGKNFVTYANGDRYEGIWKDGKRDGLFVYYKSATGVTKRVLWEAGNTIVSNKAPASRKTIAEKENERLRKENARLKKQQQSQPKKIAKKPDPQPSQALVRRTQEALKSLGLYRGAVDGVVGVQSKSALKRWQKTAGLNATGEIKEDQIARLESDALEELARREEERKAKAKRVAEANRIKNPDAIAVIIGNRDYKGNTPDVEFAANDADAMRKFVLRKLGYRSGNIIDLRDATQAELRDTFGTKESHRGRLFDYVRADESDVIVFYSGHGVPGMSDKRGYLLSVDANPNRAELTGYPVDTLLKNLSTIPAKSMTVFIDACFSGDSPKGMLVKSMSGLMVEIRQPKKTSSKMVVLTASRGDEAASWDEDAKHGLFTKHLLEALNGAADKQSKTGNKDGKVTLGEVKAYLDREMTYQARRRFSRDQYATVSGDLKTVLSAY